MIEERKRAFGLDESLSARWVRLWEIIGPQYNEILGRQLEYRERIWGGATLTPEELDAVFKSNYSAMRDCLTKKIDQQWFESNASIGQILAAERTELHELLGMYQTGFTEVGRIILTGVDDRAEAANLLDAASRFYTINFELIGSEIRAIVGSVHGQLVDASRQAGKAEIATNVLHNVGNVLNSVNVSAALVRESIGKSRIAGLGKAVSLMQEHEPDLGDYLKDDPRGKLLLTYLSQLAEQLETDRTATLNELDSLTRNIEHIKEVVAMQQTYAIGSDVKELVNIIDVLDEALQINMNTLIRHDLEVVRQFEAVPQTLLDKHAVLQILVNLIGNAKNACMESAQAKKRITVAVAKESNKIIVTLSDNGVGIPAENLIKIFNHGFTTRKDGHGFGLHSASLAAKQMGGSLRAESDGPGKGAAFILELPIEATGKLS